MPTLPVRKGAICLRKAHPLHFGLLFIPGFLVSLALEPSAVRAPAVSSGMLIVAAVVAGLIVESYFHRFEVNATGLRDISWFGQVVQEARWSEIEDYAEKSEEIVLTAGKRKITFSRGTRNWAGLDNFIRHHLSCNPRFSNCLPGLAKEPPRPRSIFDNNIPAGIFLTVWGTGWTLGWSFAPVPATYPVWFQPLAVCFGLVILIAGLRLATGWIRTTNYGIERIRAGIVCERIAWHDIDSIGIDGRYRGACRLVIWSGSRFIAVSATPGRCRELMKELGAAAKPTARIFALPEP